MILLHHKVRGVLCALAAAIVVVACDDDPSEPELGILDPQFVSPDSVIGRQEAIRIAFGDSLDARTALDPQNFVVTDRCTGLRVPGSLRLRGGDTLEFTPSRALQFLTPLDIRIQNILDTRGRALEQPFTFSVITEAPPVSDVSWRVLNSPTNDFVSGVDFLTEDIGYVSTLSGAIYETRNGGQTFGALFKDPDLIVAFGIRVLGLDTLIMTAAPSFGGTTFTSYGLFRSVDGGRSFNPVFVRDPADMGWPSVYKPAGRKGVVVIGGNQGTLSVWRHDFDTDSTHSFGPVANQVGYRAAISTNGSHALMTGEEFSFTQGVKQGYLYRSTTGGRTWVPVTTPAGTVSLFGGGFRNPTEAFVVGARSGVYRMDATNGTLTRLGAGAGIPQTDSSATTLITYNFVHVEFAEGGQIGWMIGYSQREEVGRPQVTRGLIFQTRDGGATWQRQAVSGTGDNGLGFEPVYDLTTLGPDFSVAGGNNGFLAVRDDDSAPVAGACSFTETPSTARSR